MPDAMAAALELHDGLIADGARIRRPAAEGEGRGRCNVVGVPARLRRRGLCGGVPAGAARRVVAGRARSARAGRAAYRRGARARGRLLRPALNRAARLRGLARGGATVISQATAEIVQGPPARRRSSSSISAARDLRGLSRPENVFELRLSGRPFGVRVGTRRDAYHGRSRGRRRRCGLPTSVTGRLPAPATPTIGREADCSAIAQLLRSEEIRR